MKDEGVARDRLRLLPPIRRSRLWRLYAEDGRRFLDFWMEGGRSILGAKGRAIGTVAKAAVDTGLTRPFPSIREARLAGELLRRHPGYGSVRLFRNEESAEAAAAAILAPGESLRVLKPFGEFLEAPDSASSARVATPRIPCPSPLSPGVLLFLRAEDAEGVPGDLVPPLLLACAHRALYELDRFAEEYTEALWKRVDRRLGPYFERRGPYLFPRIAEEAYDGVFAAALGAGALLSPRFDQPSIVPGDFDDGELARLAAALATQL